MVSCLTLLQGDKGAPGRAGLFGEVGETGDFGECCWDKNRPPLIQSTLGSVGTVGPQVLLVIWKQIIRIQIVAP